MTQKSPRHRLFDILNAILHVESIVAGTSERAFAADLLRLRALERELEIISEASRRISDDDKRRFPAIPWRRIADIGNVLRHQYEDIDPTLIWRVAADHLGELKAAVEILYAEAKRPSDPWPDAKPK